MNTSFERTDQKDEWLTPPAIFQPLQPFDIDVCEPVSPPWHIGQRGFNADDDGLVQSWGGVYMVQPTLRKPDEAMARKNGRSQQRNSFNICKD